MKNLAFIILTALMLLSGCESLALSGEQRIAAAKELDISKFGGNRHLRNSIYYKYFKRAFIFSNVRF